MDGITVLLDVANKDEAIKLQDAINALARRDVHNLRFLQINPDDKASLLRAIQKVRTGVLVLGGREFLKKFPPLDVLSRETEMSLLLGNEPNASNE